MGPSCSTLTPAMAGEGRVSVAAAAGGFFVRGFDRRSAVALALLLSTGASVGYRWSDLIDVDGGMDWLLAGIWVVMAGLLAWRVSARRDLLLVATGLCGGAVIEWWGTNTLLWSYFTDERPPIWILPAWPVAAISVDRLGLALDAAIDGACARFDRRLSSAAFVVSYWLLVPAFVVAMIAFVKPTAHLTPTLVVIGLMVAVTLHCPRPRRDVVVFVAGTLLGGFLEYWGTSRQCWTYYTGEIPPVVAVVAHGFAAIAFARAADFAERALGWVGGRLAAQRQSPNTVS
jgi:hypothetical protein